MVMRRLIEILLILALLIPSVESSAEVAPPPTSGVHISTAPADEATVKQSPPVAQQIQTLIATKIRRTPPVRVKVLRLFCTKPSIHSEAARHSEMRSGDVSSMRI